MAHSTTEEPQDEPATEAALLLRSPELGVGKARYLTGGLAEVDGWLNPSTALYLAGIETAQRGRLTGGICEIGVHRGKSLLAMAIDVPSDELVMAIDVFDLQHLNDDGKSHGARESFDGHLEQWGLKGQVEVVEGSSLDLEGDGFLEAGPRFRLFSIDGGHGADVVRSDLYLAEKAVAVGGIVAMDDFLNAHWLGVCTGIFDYFHHGGTLRPFALIPNKLLLSDPASLETNKTMLRELFSAGLSKEDVELLDLQIDVYTDVDWTVVDVDGVEGKLFRPASDLNSLRADLTGTRLELRRINRERRQAVKANRVLTRQLRNARRRASEARQALEHARAATAEPSTPRSLPERLDDSLPPSIRAGARQVYRWTNRRRPKH